MFDDSIDILTYPTTTDRGRTIPDYTATPTSVTITGCDVQPGASTELIAMQREGVEIRWTIYIPLDRIPADVTLDALTIIQTGAGAFMSAWAPGGMGVTGDQPSQVNGRPMSWSGAELGHAVVALVDWDVA